VKETKLTGYWEDNKGTKRAVLDRTGLWLGYKPEEVEILLVSHFIKDQPVDVLMAGTEDVTSTKVVFRIKET